MQYLAGLNLPTVSVMKAFAVQIALEKGAV